MSNKENKSLSESFLKAFGIKSHQVFGEHIVYEETERQALERKSRLLEQKLKAAKNGGFGDLRKLKEERDAVMYQLSTLAEDDLSEDKKAMMAAGKEMEAYARKNGGIDKNDFMKAAMMMKKGEIFKLQKFIDELDTEPREKIISIVQKHLKEQLGESKNYEIKNNKIYISKANFRKVHKDFKSTTKGKERMMAYDPKYGSVSYAVVFTEDTDLEEARGYGKKPVSQMTAKEKAEHDKRREEYKAYQKAKRKEMGMAESVELEEGPFKGIGKMMMKRKLKKQRDAQADANDRAWGDLGRHLKSPDHIKNAKSRDAQASTRAYAKTDKALRRLQREEVEGAYDKAFDSKELAEKFAGAVGGIVREMSGKFYVFNKEALQEAASIELAKKVKDLDDETDEKKQEAELDKVDPKQAKKKFKDRDDKDIDNDGDVDKSDEYLHKRRKAISKAVSKEKEETKESVELDENVNALAKEFEKRITKGGALASDRIQDRVRYDILGMGKKKGVDMKALDAAIIKVMNRLNEEVELDEAKSDYETGHKDFSSAVQHAKAVVQKRGYEIEGEDWDKNVALGPRKPSKGKTNSYHIPVQKKGKTKKEMLHMQVYNDGNRYELNMYIQ